jgi:hypothetical protein
MRSKSFLIVAVLCSLGLGLTSSNASAQFPCYGGFGGYWGGFFNRYSDQNPPYFAMFPPVYYSVPVARTYGYSPFAYPPGVMTPEVQIEVPATIMNPFVAPKNELPKGEPTPADNSSHRSASIGMPKRVQLVVNPYVIELERVGKK